VSVQWQKFFVFGGWTSIFDGPTGNGSSYFGTQTTTFSVFNAQGADSGSYRCFFLVAGCNPFNTLGISNAAQLTIIDSLPAILGPDNTAGCPGDNDAYLSVTVNPCVGCTFQWQKRTGVCIGCFGNIFDGATGNGGSYGGTQTPNLTVAGLYPGDFTDYRCIINMPCAGNITSGEASISPSPAPSITGPTVGQACQGGSASMSISATPPGSTYPWQKYVGPCFLCWQNIFNGPTGNGGTFAGTQSSTFTINGLDLLDTVTTYRCIVTEPCGLYTGASADGYFILLVNPIIQTQPVGGPVCKNGTKTLSVVLAPGGYGPLTYQWYRYIPAFPIYQQVGNGGCSACTRLRPERRLRGRNASFPNADRTSRYGAMSRRDR
jgi:hypothetical protein